MEEMEEQLIPIFSPPIATRVKIHSSHCFHLLPASASTTAFFFPFVGCLHSRALLLYSKLQQNQILSCTCRIHQRQHFLLNVQKHFENNTELKINICGRLRWVRRIQKIRLFFKQHGSYREQLCDVLYCKTCTASHGMPILCFTFSLRGFFSAYVCKQSELRKLLPPIPHPHIL